MTEKQCAFVLEYARNGGNASAAARAAGYPEKSAHEQGRQQLEKPHIREAIYKELMKLRHRSGAIGLSALVNIAQDDKNPAAARVAAARTLIDHAGLLAANEVAWAEEEDDGSNVVDYRSVLEDLGKIQRTWIKAG
jgi:hypothetical protein